MKKIIFIKLILLFAFSINFFAIDTPFFYKGARPIALGDAFTAIVDDENAISYNPAGLMNINENKIAIAGKLFSYDFLNENYTNNTVSFSLVYAKSFGIQIFYNLLGDKILLDADRTFLYEGIKIVAAFAYDINDYLYIGLSGNVTIQTGKAGGVEFDSGAIYKFNKYLKMGITIKNFINSGNFLIIDDYGNVGIISYPIFFNWGISAKPFDFFLLSFEIKNIFETESFFVDDKIERNKSIIFKRSYHIGAELNFLENYFFMIGLKAGEDIYRFENHNTYKMRNLVSSGLGYNLNFIRINASIANDFREVFNIKNPWQIYLSIAGDY